jgi:AraC family transcriptional regulator
MKEHTYSERVQRVVECLATHLDGKLDLETAYDWLYRTWLPHSGEELRNLPCLEEYLNDPRHVSVKDLRTAVMMPLKG